MIDETELCVFDIEADDLKATVIHCLSYNIISGNEGVKTLTRYEDMKALMERKDITFIGHKIITYDIPTIKRLTGADITADLIDTLSLSWYLEPERKRHGLEYYGEEFGIPKPVVKDWKNQPKEVYIKRCEQDTRINSKLWSRQYNYLKKIYETSEDMSRFLAYLAFKLDCVREQEDRGLLMDEQLCRRVKKELEDERAEKLEKLVQAMPRVNKDKIKEIPKVIKKKNGDFSKQGELWFDLLKEQGLKEETLRIVVKEHSEPGNPNSSSQVKAWLYSKGWEPKTHKFVKDKKTGEIRKVPQITLPNSNGDVCKSVKDLFDKWPEFKLLQGLSILNHRISIFDSFLKESESDGRLYATTAGLTNTLRLQHSVIVNLPGVDKKYGKEVRGCIIADKGHVLCGSDLSGIEDNTKRHYIYRYDPDYVEEMNTPGYDAHLEIAVLAGYMSREEADWYKAEDARKVNPAYKPTPEDKEKYGNLKPIRTKAKITNFSATYKVGATTLSRNSGMPIQEAQKLLDIYWKRNNAIKLVEDSLTVKEIGNSKWLLNPINGFFYSLRAEKDRFSTLNQGTAVYVFDIWIMFLRELGIQIQLQYHDEVLFNVVEGKEQETRDIIAKAMKEVNDYLKLNVTIGCSVEFGPNYADCH